MSNRLLKLLPILLAFVLICSVSAFAAFADEESSADTSSEVSVEASDASSEEASADESTEESGDESAEESGDESDEESGDESETTSSATSSAVSGATSATTSHDHDHGDESSGGLSARTWQLIITLAVIVVLVAVLFILAKTNTKFGQKIAKFFKDNKSELKKVVWMPRNDLIKSTGIVLVVLVCACILIGLLDLGFSSLLNLLSSIG